MTPAVPEEIGLVGTLDALPTGDHGAHQPADEDGARQGGVPAVRAAHRQVALGRLLRQGRARGVQRGVVGAHGAVPGRPPARSRARKTTSTPAPSTTWRRARRTSSLLPRAHLPVPVPQGALCRGRVHGAARRSARFTASKAAGAKLMAMLALGASKPWPDAMEAVGAGAEGRRGADARVLQATLAVAHRPEQRSKVRMVTGIMPRSGCFCGGSRG